MPWMMDRFLRVEDEAFVSPPRLKDQTHMFLFRLYFKSWMGYVPLYSKV